MRRVPILTALLLALIPATASAATQPKAPGILYSLDAKGATITKSGGTFRLSMPANTPVTWFTDRPARNAGMVRLIDLYGIWDASGFNDDPPNAALLTMHKGAERTHVVEMTKPELATGRVSFAIQAIPTAVEAGHGHTHGLATGRFGRARLFIDDAALSPCLGVGPTASTSPYTPTVTQCLLAPGRKTVFSWPSGSSGLTIVQACFTGTTASYIPNYQYGDQTVMGTVCTTSATNDRVVVTRGFSNPVPIAITSCSTIPQPSPQYPDATTTSCITETLPNPCPTPPNNRWMFGNAAAAPSALRITVTDGQSLDCKI